jgi:hypothetical protein
VETLGGGQLKDWESDGGFIGANGNITPELVNFMAYLARGLLVWPAMICRVIDVVPEYPLWTGPARHIFDPHPKKENCYVVSSIGCCNVE